MYFKQDLNWVLLSQSDRFQRKKLEPNQPCTVSVTENNKKMLEAFEIEFRSYYKPKGDILHMGCLFTFCWVSETKVIYLKKSKHLTKNGESNTLLCLFNESS